MFYDIIENMDFEEEDEYSWEIIDGQPRYRWYKDALNSVHLIECSDANHNIDNENFSDLKPWYDGVKWVTQNDPEALKYIMGVLTEPVTHIVKEKFLDNLKKLEYYKACAIVNEHLRSYPVPKERTLKRNKEKSLSDISFLVIRIKSTSDLLYKAKTKQQHKLHDEELKECLGALLNIDGLLGGNIEKEILAMEWLRENSPDDVKNQFTEKVCIEIKDQLIRILSEYEKYKLCSFLKELIETYGLPDYYNIPPYIPKENFLFDDMDDY